MEVSHDSMSGHNNKGVNINFAAQMGHQIKPIYQWLGRGYRWGRGGGMGVGWKIPVERPRLKHCEVAIPSSRTWMN